MEAGIYHYDVNSHSLNLHREGDFRTDLAQAALSQGFIRVAPIDVIVCALYPGLHTDTVNAANDMSTWR